MKERPILFSAEMVRAILEGRKTQTRRVIKPQPEIMLNPYDREQTVLVWDKTQNHRIHSVPAGLVPDNPFAQEVGGRLWVREGMWLSSCGQYFARQRYSDSGGYPTSYDVLARDGSGVWKNSAWSNKGRWLKSGRQTKEFSLSWHNDNDKILEAEFRRRWPSIFMPRWASRLTLEAVNIRVERVQDISVSDMRAEGVEYGPHNRGEFAIQHTIREWKTLWDSINAKRGYPWESNPWVWVLEFKRIQ